MMNIDDIKLFFQNQNLDIRIKGNNPRFIDQKCTPDVLSFIADMIVHLNKQCISLNDIWENTEFIKRVPIIFGKPSPTNQARNEYNKFIGQNLELLAYTGILKKQRIGKSYSYIIIEKEILEYIGLKDWNAFLFLDLYFNKFLQDSGLITQVNIFFQLQDKRSFYDLKEQFIKFMLNNTKIGSRSSSDGGKREIMRMFPKIINILAVNKTKNGSVRGRISKGNMNYSELMYNRENFRDHDKPKNITRQENSTRQHNSTSTIRYNEYLIEKANEYLIKKTKELVKRNHPSSEVNDNQKGRTGHIHHIFPKAEFPIIANYIENLIALTAGQHLSSAHPNGNTSRIDPAYQQVCLRAKSKTIEKELQKGNKLYSKESFAYVINVGFKWVRTDEELSSSSTFQEINDSITKYYKYQ